MSENVTTQRVLNQEEMAQLITIAQFAKLVGCSSGVVRKEGKKGNIPGCYHVMGTIGFNPTEAKGWSAPSGSAPRVSRSDGRLLYNVALLAAELTTLTEAGYEIIDPRVAAAAKREARKAARAAAKAAEVVATVVTDDEEDVDDDDFFDDTDE